MVKKLLLGFSILASIGATAQMNFPGYRAGNYTGVNGVFFNPANIADSRYRWDINLLSVNAGIGNNNATFKLKNIGDAFNGDKAKDQLLGTSGKNTNGTVNVDVFGPSFMFNATPKLSFAFTTRLRALTNVKDIDGKFINAMNNDDIVGSTLGSNANQKIAANGWADYGVSMGLPLVNNGKHFLKGGLTVKYLAGAINSFANINNLHATVNENASGDYYLTNTTGKVAIGYSGLDLDNFDAGNAFDFKGSGIGGDLGFVYEYRPDEEKTGRDQNKYKFKIGVSLLDIGAIKYKPTNNEYGNYTASITGAEAWDPSELNGKSISEIKSYLDGHNTLFTNNNAKLESYKAKLPTTLQANIDYHLHRGFYVDLGGQLNMAKKDDIYSAFSYNSVTLTPRYEGKAFGIYVPVNYNELTNFNAGVSFRLGPVFFGSGSVLTALFDKSKQADVHFGLRFGVLNKKAKKVKEVVIEPVIEEVKQVIEEVKPPADSDGDGITDDKDQCPNVAGLAKYHGCPVPDSDGDGINDENDKCPNTPGIAKYHGCPVPDTDGDGVNDEDDRCPTLAGTVANQGCPEVKQEVVKKVNVVAQNILFQTGKAVLMPSSLKQLDQLATILKQDADLKMNINGHTDNTGKPALNQTLSQKRSDAVKAYLLKKGISEERLSATGYGDTQPKATNKTAAGRTQNRRVELKLDY